MVPCIGGIDNTLSTRIYCDRIVVYVSINSLRYRELVAIDEYFRHRQYVKALENAGISTIVSEFKYTFVATPPKRFAQARSLGDGVNPQAR